MTKLRLRFQYQDAITVPVLLTSASPPPALAAGGGNWSNSIIHPPHEYNTFDFNSVHNDSLVPTELL